jgi:hypothetical protein
VTGARARRGIIIDVPIAIDQRSFDPGPQDRR